MPSQRLESKVLSPDNRLFLNRPAAAIFDIEGEKKSVCFMGSIGKDPAPGKTYQDKGILPLLHAPFSLRYLFPFLLVNVHLNENSTSINCAADASTTSVCMEQGFDLFNNRIDYLFNALVESVYIAKSDIVSKGCKGEQPYAAIVERYPLIRYVDFVKTSFNRYVVFNMPLEEGGIAALVHLGKELKEHYVDLNASDVDINSPNVFMKRMLQLDSELRVSMQASNIGNMLTISSEAFYSRDKFEEAVRFITESDAMKARKLKVDYNDPNMFGVKWMIRFPTGGNYVLEEVFRDDIEQARK